MARRRRSWRTALNPNTMIWVGPREPQQIMKHYLHYFQNMVEMNVDSFLVATDEEHDRHTAELAKLQRNFARGGKMLTPRACMTKATYQRLLAYEKVYAARPPHEPTGFVVDLSQNLTMARCGSILLAATTSSSFFSISRRRFFTTTDLQCSQGRPDPQCDLHGELLTFSRADSRGARDRSLFGNGVHLVRAGLVSLYISCFSHRREIVLRIADASRPPATGSVWAGAGDRHGDGLRSGPPLVAITPAHSHRPLRPAPLTIIVVRRWGNT